MQAMGAWFFLSRITEPRLNAMYGALATPMALLTWLKWGATAILLGAETDVRLQPHQSFTRSGAAKDRTLVDEPRLHE
jgi:uncharacterized BrkB/YihY/UPF0761 family membrane protein